jgi:plasmid maintenance system antidote protein VapI
MKTSDSFEPDWVSPPGATVRNLLDERGCTINDFARAVHRGTQEVSRLLYGHDQLTQDWAEQLARTLGASPTFWLRREEQYRRDVARLVKESNHDDSNAWLSELPLEDMIRFGWLKKGSSKEESLGNALTFFGVPSVESWHRRYRGALEAAAYRASEAYETRPGSVAAWLRQGELSAAELDCQPWNAEQLREALPMLRSLTRDPDPERFLPELVRLCSGCGIAVVVERAPSGCRASGCVRFLTPKKALLLLSFRYLSDDQFWFTVFHEIGHLLLHSRDSLFLEGVETANKPLEAEADAFANLHLLTEQGLRALYSIPLNHFAIARLAKRVGVSPGIVVGRLQEMKRVPYRHFNYLKARYAWRDA